ncbi:hypothetical protein JR316_0000140 [Psilocybe cubensis]|uniref:Uncharacterized protein n=1 Tax=Psilocybe cubensis TaxID=181762 RepID=A0ACB8HDX2_PSICU|nr:hypothetical protein JR316_0000140 [Psilocybe cubensis]KAH9486076.1 hypothetical protein JR316_0000140 [Psilocybe cubensis]
MAPLGEGPSSALDSTFGAMLIGVFFAIFFQGVLSFQAWNYYENFPNDPLKFKLLVSVAWGLDTIHTVIICQFMYHYLVTNWGFQAALVDATTELIIHILLVGMSCFVCQVYFMHRIWILSEKKILVLCIALAPSLTALILNIHLPLKMIFAHFSIPELVLTEKESAALYFISALSDVVIAGFLCYFLRLSNRRTQFQATRLVLKDILHYVVATGILTSACEIGAVIAAIHFSLGRLYTNSLLAALNSRKKIRDRLQGNASGIGQSIHSHGAGKQKDIHMVSIKAASDEVPESKRVPQASMVRPSEITFTVERVIQDDNGDTSKRNSDQRAHAIWQTSTDYERRT